MRSPMQQGKSDSHPLVMFESQSKRPVGQTATQPEASAAQDQESAEASAAIAVQSRSQEPQVSSALRSTQAPEHS